MKTVQRAKIVTTVRAIVHTTGLYSRGVDYVVDNRDPAKLKIEDFPEGTFAIQYYDFIYTEIEYNGEIHPLKSGELNPSPVIYMAGKLLDREQLAEDYPDIAINLIKQMNDFNLNYVVLYAGKFKLFNTGDLFWGREDHRKYYYDGTESK